LLWAAALVVAAGVAGLVIALLPEHHGGIASSVESGPVQTVARPKQVRMTPHVRRRIDRLFDRFVPAAIARRDPIGARAYVTPSLRSQATRAEWRAGTIPVPPFDPAGTTFHGWTTIYSYPRDISVELTLEPRRPRDPVGSFVVNLKRPGSRWLVDGIYAHGTHGGESAAAPNTTAAPTTTEPVIGGSRGRARRRLAPRSARLPLADRDRPDPRVRTRLAGRPTGQPQASTGPLERAPAASPSPQPSVELLQGGQREFDHLCLAPLTGLDLDRVQRPEQRVPFRRLLGEQVSR
jgi:hypothetical protein